MDVAINESTFIDMIRETCINECKKYNICPSVIGAIAILESEYGTSKLFHTTKNIFKMTANNTYSGKVYSLDSGITYQSISECNEIGAILYRVYRYHQASIIDFVENLMNSRRSENGPLKYAILSDCSNYRECLDKFDRAGFITLRNSNTSPFVYHQNLIYIIEKYGLYNWDEYLMEEEVEMSNRKRKKFTANPQINKEDTLEQVEHMYRVRLDWDNPDTQIFSSPNYDDALEEALNHEGYKIFIDDDGELFEDPWAPDEDPEEGQKNLEPFDNIPGLNKIVQVIPGKVIHLKMTPVYRNCLAKTPFTYITGDFYYYDKSIVNGFAKITKYKEIKKPDPTLIFGCIKVR